MPVMLAQSVDAGSWRFFELLQIAMNHFVDQTRFTGAGHPGDADEHPERNFHVDVFKVIGPGAA